MIGFSFDELPDQAEDARSHMERVLDEKIITQMQSWELTATRSFAHGTPWSGCGIIIMFGSDQQEARFLLVGWGFQVSFRQLDPSAAFTGISSFQEKIVMNRNT